MLVSKVFVAFKVVLSDGHSYERESITTWLRAHNTSPMTGEELEHKQMVSNRTLRSAIHAYMENSAREVAAVAALSQYAKQKSSDSECTTATNIDRYEVNAWKLFV